MNREVLLGKLETCIPNNDTKRFIDSIFDLTDEDIISLTEEELNRVFSISKQINMENVDEFFEYLEDEGDYCLNNSRNGIDEFNNAILGKFYSGLYIILSKKRDEKLGLALLNKGFACHLLSYFGVETIANIEISLKLYKEAQEIFPKDSTDYARVLIYEANTRLRLAKMGVQTHENLEKVIKLNQSSQKISQPNSTYYASSLGNEANARLELADMGVQTHENLEKVIKLNQSAQKLFQPNSLDYARSLMNESTARRRLANRDLQKLEKVIKLNQSAQKIFQPNSTDYARSLLNESTARIILAEGGMQTHENLEKVIKLNQSAQKIFQPNSISYARTLTNEAVARQRLSDFNVDIQDNLEKAIRLYKEVQEIFPRGSTYYASILLNEATARETLAERGVYTQENLDYAVKLCIQSISILEKSNDGGIYSTVLLNLNRLFTDRFRKSGDRKYLEEAKNILEDAETKIKDREVWDKEKIQAKLHEIRANLLEFEGKSGIEEAAREYNEAYKLTRIPYSNFMDEFSRARVDIEDGAFCKLVEKWKETKKDSIFLDYYDYSVYECHLEKAIDSSGIKREDEFKLARKKLEEIRDRTEIKIINDRVSAYVFLMNALVDSFRKGRYDDAKDNIREAYKIFDKYNDKDGIKTCELFSDAVIKKKDPEAWRKILLKKDKLSCNIFRLLSEGADIKEKEARKGELISGLESKIDDISIKIYELKTDLNTGFGHIKDRVEQGFEDKNEQSQDIINRLEETQLKLEKLAEISETSKGNEGKSIRQFSKQILLLLENEDSEALERFVKEVINNEESLITEIDDSAMPDKDKTKAKGTLKKFKKISGKAKKEAGLFGRNVSYNLTAALLAEEIIKHVFPLISTAAIGVPIPSQLLELLSKAIPKK